MQSKAKTVAQYLAELSPERRAALAAVRKVILANLDDDYEEGMDGMISYHVPHRVYPPGYHCNPDQPLPFAGLASQKSYMSLYLMSVYADGAEEGWLRKRFAAAGKKLDMGKCCVRFKHISDLPLEVIGEAIRRVPAAAYVAHYERSILAKNKSAAASRKTGATGNETGNGTKSAVRAGARKTGKRVARKA
jgi:hypothetical protein